MTALHGMNALTILGLGMLVAIGLGAVLTLCCRVSVESMVNRALTDPSYRCIDEKDEENLGANL